MDIQETVFDALVPDKEEGDYSNLSVFDLLQSTYTLNHEDSVELTDIILGKINDGADGDEVVYFFALLSSARQYDHRLKENLGLVIDYHLYKKESIIDEIKKRVLIIEKEFKAQENRDRYRSIFPGADSALDYLEEFFQDDLLDEIVTITGVSKATVKRYRKGGNPRYYTEDMLIRLAKIFYCLKEDQNKTNQEVLDFYRNKKLIKLRNLGNAQTLAEYLKSYKYFSAMSFQGLSEYGIPEDIL
jgi:transcriptional regulator with XRE-family HTH domain